MPIRHDTTAPRSALWDNDHVGNLDDLDDVNAPTPSDNDSLTWDAATSTWVPEAVGGGGISFPLGATITWDTDSTYDVGETATRPATVFADVLDAPTITLGASEVADVAGDVTFDTVDGLTVAVNRGFVGAAEKWQVANDLLPLDGASTQDIGATGGWVSKVWAGEYTGVNDLAIDLSVTGATTIAIDDGATQDLTLTGDATFTLTASTHNPAGRAQDLRLILRQDGTGGWEVTWPGSVVWAGGSAPVLQTAANAVDTIGLLSVDDGTSWFGYHVDVGTAIAGIEVAEQDGTPDVADVTRIEFVGATVTDDTGGQVTVTVASSSMTTAEIAALGFVGRIVMVDGITDPPEPLVTEDLDDYVYEDLP